jgi:hypothetical protein
VLQSLNLVIDAAKLPFHQTIARYQASIFVFTVLCIPRLTRWRSNVKGLCKRSCRVLAAGHARVKPLAVRSRPLLYDSLENEPCSRGIDPRILRGYRILEPSTLREKLGARHARARIYL